MVFLDCTRILRLLAIEIHLDDFIRRFFVEFELDSEPVGRPKPQSPPLVSQTTE